MYVTSDGKFSKIMDKASMLKTFENMLEEQNKEVKALYFGTPEELEEIKTEKTLEYRVGELEEMVESLKPKKPSSIFEPTPAQIKHVMETHAKGIKK